MPNNHQSLRPGNVYQQHPGHYYILLSCLDKNRQQGWLLASLDQIGTQSNSPKLTNEMRLYMLNRRITYIGHLSELKREFFQRDCSSVTRVFGSFFSLGDQTFLTSSATIGSVKRCVMVQLDLDIEQQNCKILSDTHISSHYTFLETHTHTNIWNRCSPYITS